MTDNKPSSCLSLIFLLVSLCLMSGVWGCAKKTVEKPATPPAAVKPEPGGPAEPEKTVSVIPILMAEADKYISENNYQDALFVYNQALGQAAPDERPAIVTALEKALLQTPPQVIDSFARIKNLSLPQGLLYYYLGLNHAVREAWEPARAALEAFVQQYAGHPYISDAMDLLQDIQRATFNRQIIGCLLPLSGKYSVYGQRALQGIQLAVQDLANTHGKQFKVLVKDTGADPDRAAACVDELAREKVLGIVGPLLAPEAAGKRAQEHKIPLIAMTQKTDFPGQGEFLFSNFITPQMQVQTLGSYLFMELGVKKVAILYPEERYGRLYKDLFWDVVDEFRGEVVGVESYDGSKTDFTTPVKKLTGAYYPVPGFLRPPEEEPASLDGTGEGESRDPSRFKPSARSSAVANEERHKIDFEALFIPDSLSRVNLILPQLAFNDARGMVLAGTNLWHQKSLLTQSRGYNRKAVITDGYFGGSARPLTARFHKVFTELYGTAPGFLEAISYDTAHILFTAAMGEDVDSRMGVKNALQGRVMFEGVTGQTIFDKSGSPHKELFLITVKRGKFREIR